MSRFHEYKHAVEDKFYGPLVKTVMTRCIHCTRCIRFNEEICGQHDIGTIWRGGSTEISCYVTKLLESELSGNIVDLCPVGALTNGPYEFRARPWELRTINSIDITDSLGSSIAINAKGGEVLRVLPKVHEEVNEDWISDKARHSFDGLKMQRLTEPLLQHEGTWTPLSWEEATS